MPQGPLGAPRPFSSCQLMFDSRYNIDRGMGERLESNDVRENAERLIAQSISDSTEFSEPAVQLAPAGWVLLVQVGLDGPIASEGRRTTGVDELLEIVEQAVKSAVDSNATLGEGIDNPDWEIYCR